MINEEELMLLSVEELRNKLIEAGLSEEEANNIKYKNNLRDALRALVMQDTTEGNIEDETDQEQSDNNLPQFGSLEWHNFVMSQFTPDELSEGKKKDDLMPRLFGLRRVVNLLIGNVLENTVEVIDSPKESNDYSTVVKSQIIIYDAAGVGRVYSDVADCSRHNCDRPYNQHLTSTAASKAEARNLRKILGLRNIISAEEYSEKAEESSPLGETNFLNPTSILEAQIAALDTTAQRNNINLMKYINKNPEEQYNKINEIPYKRAVEMLDTLMRFQNKHEGFEIVPEDLQGYDPKWRSNN